MDDDWIFDWIGVIGSFLIICAPAIYCAYRSWVILSRNK